MQRAQRAETVVNICNGFSVVALLASHVGGGLFFLWRLLASHVGGGLVFRWRLCWLVTWVVVWFFGGGFAG